MKGKVRAENGYIHLVDASNPKRRSHRV